VLLLLFCASRVTASAAVLASSMLRAYSSCMQQRMRHYTGRFQYLSRAAGCAAQRVQATGAAKSWHSSKAEQRM
jgi:phage tail tape-measure protein